MIFCLFNRKSDQNVPLFLILEYIIFKPDMIVISIIIVVQHELETNKMLLFSFLLTVFFFYNAEKMRCVFLCMVYTYGAFNQKRFEAPGFVREAKRLSERYERLKFSGI